MSGMPPPTPPPMTPAAFAEPVDEPSPAVPMGPSYPVVDGNDLTGTFSPDGTSIIVNNTATKETRLIDAGTGGDGRVLPWTADGGTAWQRLAP